MIAGPPVRSRGDVEPPSPRISPLAELLAALSEAFEGRATPAWLPDAILSLRAYREARTGFASAGVAPVARASFAATLPRLGTVTVEIALHEGRASIAYVTAENAALRALESDRVNLAHALAARQIGPCAAVVRTLAEAPSIDLGERMDAWT
jgi:hypothetical protein